MGGRGASSGASRSSGSKGYTPDGTIKLDGDVMHVERLTGMSSYGGSGAIVLEAKTDGNGNITLEYARETGYRQQNKKTSYAQYEIKAGLTNRSETGKAADFRSNNIDWGKVKTVSGKTYGTQSFMRSKGFDWNPNKKRWERK